MRLLALLILFGTTPAWAIPVQWSLDDVGFSSGGPSTTPVTGTFTYDADTSIVSDVLIFGWFVDPFTQGVDVSGNGSYLAFTGSSGVITFEFTSPLTNAGGTAFLEDGTPGAAVDLTQIGSIIGACSNINVCPGQLAGFDDNFSPGRLVGTVVPIPAAVWLFGSGLVLLSWMRRRQAS